MRLLVAEDEAPIRDLLVRGLSESGYVVDAAENGGDALHLLRVYDYAAAVIDWRMPEKTGVEVVRAARLHHLEVPVLMLTARDALSDRVEGVRWRGSGTSCDLSPDPPRVAAMREPGATRSCPP